MPRVRTALEQQGDPGVLITLTKPGDAREKEYLRRATEALRDEPESRFQVLELLSDPRVLRDSDLLKLVVEKAVSLEKTFPVGERFATLATLPEILNSLAELPQFKAGTEWPEYFKNVASWLSSQEKRAEHLTRVARSRPAAPRASASGLIKDALWALVSRCTRAEIR